MVNNFLLEGKKQDGNYFPKREKKRCKDYAIILVSFLA
jgi:hypothetical protein